MGNTILEKLQDRFPDRPGVDDARNIAEVLAGNRGANAIADVVDGFGKSTVLYTDGLLIINELAEDRAANVAAHGAVVKEYDPWCKRQPYVFDSMLDIPWYDDRESILSVKIGSKVVAKKTANWFVDLTKCTAIDTTGLDTSNVFTMNQMFRNCKSLTSVNLSGLDTSNVHIMRYMFRDCNALTSLDLSSFDTSNVTSMLGTFQNCKALTSLDLSGFDTSNCTTFQQTFFGCSNLQSLNVSGFDVTNVRIFAGTFYNCQKLTSLDLSNYAALKVTNMGSMFFNCIGLTSLDLRGFDTSNVTEITDVFKNCSNLETISVTDRFIVGADIPDAEMFLNCTSLVGGNGTTYDANHVNSEYARIDTEETPGYFTAAS